MIGPFWVLPRSSESSRTRSRSDLPPLQEETDLPGFLFPRRYRRLFRD